MRYWLQRLGAAIVLLLAVSALTFGAMNLLGDPLFNILGPTAASTTPEDLEIIADACLSATSSGPARSLSATSGCNSASMVSLP